MVNLTKNGVYDQLQEKIFFVIDNGQFNKKIVCVIRSVQRAIKKEDQAD